MVIQIYIKALLKYHTIKKNCYLQCRTFDNTYSNYINYKNITKGYPKDHVILLSEHYRDILGITEDNITKSKNFDEQHHQKIYDIKKCKLKISYPRNRIEKYVYYYMAAWQHPNIYAKTSIIVSILSLFLGFLGLILGLCSMDVFSNLLSLKSDLPRNVYIFSLGGFAGYIYTHISSEKMTKAAWVFLTILLFMALYFIL